MRKSTTQIQIRTILRQAVLVKISCFFQPSLHVVDEWLELSVKSDERFYFAIPFLSFLCRSFDVFSGTYLLHFSLLKDRDSWIEFLLSVISHFCGPWTVPPPPPPSPVRPSQKWRKLLHKMEKNSAYFSHTCTSLCKVKGNKHLLVKIITDFLFIQV